MPKQEPLILVAEDDPTMLKMVRRTLELEGYQVVTANNGKTALQLIKDAEPALVLLDVMMPGLNGFQVCEQARQFSGVPIIMVTAKDQLDDVVHGLEIGADDYIVKPFTTRQLAARVRKVFFLSRRIGGQ